MTLELLQFISLTAFAFGAMTFTLLAVAWWRQRSPARRLFGAFTTICAASFLSSLALALPPLSVMPGLLSLRDFLVAAVPPMMVHLSLDREQWHLPAASVWKALVASVYLISLVPYLSATPEYGLMYASALAIAGLSASRHRSTPALRRHRSRNIVLFALLFLTAILAHLTENPVFELLPDYLLLAFFAVWLYYSERLAFFDVFLRGGAYFLSGAILIGAVTTVWPGAGSAFALLGLWLVGPVIHTRVSQWVDRAALNRRYGPAEAEREFTLAIHRSATERDLHHAAIAALNSIFRTTAELSFAAPDLTAGPDDLHAPLTPHGSILLRPRPSAIPFLSDDRRLLDTLSATLSLALQNVRYRQQQQELAAGAARAELRALRAQINPHFLFNALNAIAGWIRTRPDLADETIAQLAEVFRYALNRSQQEWVRLSDELDFLRSCLAVEKARFGDRLEIRIDADPSLVTRAMIPVMLLQPVVENATRHGTSQVEGVGRLSLAVRATGGRITVEVEDNGPGFPPGFSIEGIGSDHHGMRNVADRLRGYYGDRAGLKWENLSEGCRVTLHFPVSRNDNDPSPAGR